MQGSVIESPIFESNWAILSARTIFATSLAPAESFSERHCEAPVLTKAFTRRVSELMKLPQLRGPHAIELLVHRYYVDSLEKLHENVES